MGDQDAEQGAWAWLFAGDVRPWRLGPSATLSFARGIEPARMFDVFGIAPADVEPMSAAAELDMAAEGMLEGPFWLRVAAEPGWTVGIELAQKAYLDGLGPALSTGGEAVVITVNVKSFGLVQHFRDRALVASFSINDASFDVHGPDPAGLQDALVQAGLSPVTGPVPYRDQLMGTMDVLTQVFGVALSEATYVGTLPTGFREHRDQP